MTKSRSSLASLAFALMAAGCASSGDPAARIAQANIAAGYLPLHATTHLGIDSIDAASVVVAPGIAATNGHNANLVDPRSVIGTISDYDLMFFRTTRGAPPQIGPVAVGAAVAAYGQGEDRDLRIAHGIVREIHMCPGCKVPAYFTFAGNAGPGFSGGPVLNAAGQLIGITFGYKDSRHERLIYAYGMDRVMEELSIVQKVQN
jgi:hypothetical protein